MILSSDCFLISNAKLCLFFGYSYALILVDQMVSLNPFLKLSRLNDILDFDSPLYTPKFTVETWFLLVNLANL